MNRQFAKLQLRPVIDTVYPFENALAACKQLDRGPFGKIVIRARQ